MSDQETEFESESFDEETEPSPDSIALNLTSEWPLHCDGTLVGRSITNRTWQFTPKMLKKLAAQRLIGLKPPHKLQNRYIPPHLYPLLFGEAARMKSDEVIWFLVSTWPFPILNLNELELPLECHFGYFTRNKGETIPLADSIIRGILYRSRMHCKMKMLVLPKVVGEASELMKAFMRLPVHFLRDLPGVSVPKLLQSGQYLEGDKFMELIKKIETKRPISYTAYRKDKLKLVIAMPAGVVHFIGNKQNYDEVIAGLILQRSAPFIFHFEELAICNIPETKLAGAILDRLANPLGVTKLVLHNKRFYRPDDVVSMVSVLSPVLRKFERLQAVFFRVIGVLGVHSLADAEARAPFTETFMGWKEVKRAGFDDQPLTGQLETILTPLMTPLLKLSLVNARLQPDDLRALAKSRHAASLQYLRLDQNDLHTGVDAFVELIPQLRSVIVLQTRRCQLTFDDAMAIAKALGVSKTIRSWTLAYSYVHTLEELKVLLRQCSKVGSLREVGCRPAEYQRLFNRLFMHNKFHLTEDEKEQLNSFGRSLNINII